MSDTDGARAGASDGGGTHGGPPGSPDDPVRVDSSGDITAAVHGRVVELLDRGDEGALATVIGAYGSTPGRPGMKMLVERSGAITGTVGGGLLEDRVLEGARGVLATGNPERLNLSLSPRAEDKVGICGGELEVYVEPIGVHTVYLFGSGHVALRRRGRRRSGGVLLGGARRPSRGNRSRFFDHVGERYELAVDM